MLAPMNAGGDPTPFWLGPERARGGVLVVHGFTGTPFEMRPLGEALAARGLVVLGPALAGHCGTTSDLAATRWPDWVSSVERAFDALRERCERVAVVGLSLGGLLTLELARRRPQQTSAIALLATALWLNDTAARFDRLVQRLPVVRGLAMPKLAGSDLSDREMRRLNQIAQGKAGMPLPALHSLVEFGRYMKPRVGEVKAPALVGHGRHDHTIPFECMEYLVRALGSKEITQLVLERSFHVVTLDVEREQVFDAVCKHVTKYL
jgi:carboxylesterase